jgi:hypothetical protein
METDKFGPDADVEKNEAEYPPEIESQTRVHSRQGEQDSDKIKGAGDDGSDDTVAEGTPTSAAAKPGEEPIYVEWEENE